MADLFDTPSDDRPAETAPHPLADRLRPRRLADVIGQDHLLGRDGSLSAMLAAGRLPSLIFWGPPGTGKTTIARLLAAETDLAFVQVSAIFSGVQELRKVFEAAKHRRSHGQGTLLFVDEIHRFNKAQQDGFLPHMEDGTIVLVGATTENPSFELNAALLSRAQVLVLHRLDAAALAALLERAEADLGTPLALDAGAREALIPMADGDGRALLNLVEQIAGWDETLPLDTATLSARLSRRAAQYDKSGDAHFNLISALHKSVRGSDPDAALYWLARMLRGGEDPRYLARRITRMAIEDIGLADPQAQSLCLDAWQTYERLRSPQGYLVNTAFMRALGPGFPWATLVVNVAGSFLMGALIVLLARRGGHHLAPLLMTGVLGGFTTFSAFSLDVATLYERGAVAAAAAYAAASVVLSVGALFAALWLLRAAPA